MLSSIPFMGKEFFEIILEKKKALNCSVWWTGKSKMNIIFYIDEDRHLLGDSIEITCTEFELLV